MTKRAKNQQPEWTLLVEAAVTRFLRKLDDRNTAVRIVRQMEALQSNPFPAGCKKLEGSTNEYRIRIGDFRVLYSVEARGRTVWIFDVDRRDKIYRRR